MKVLTLSMQTFFGRSFSTTFRVMDVRADNRGRPHQKSAFSCSPSGEEKRFDHPGHPGVRVRNVRGEKFMFMLFFLP